MNVISETDEEIREEQLKTIDEMCKNFSDCNGTCGTLARLILGVINEQSNNWCRYIFI